MDYLNHMPENPQELQVCREKVDEKISDLQDEIHSYSLQIKDLEKKTKMKSELLVEYAYQKYKLTFFPSFNDRHSDD